MKKVRTSKPPFSLGDRVKFAIVQGTVSGVIVQDRGEVRIPGRHLYRVEVAADPDEPAYFIVASDEIEPDDTPDPPPVPDKARVMEYLKKGGLVSVLRQNTPGGRSQPHVWLCFDTLGNVTHTFRPERGGLGGEAVPFGTLHENMRVFSAKKDRVAKFLESFGLTAAEADEVIRAVGTAPGPDDGR